MTSGFRDLKVDFEPDLKVDFDHFDHFRFHGGRARLFSQERFAFGNVNFRERLYFFYERFVI